MGDSAGGSKAFKGFKWKLLQEYKKQQVEQQKKDEDERKSTTNEDQGQHALPVPSQALSQAPRKLHKQVSVEAESAQRQVEAAAQTATEVLPGPARCGSGELKSTRGQEAVKCSVSYQQGAAQGVVGSVPIHLEEAVTTPTATAPTLAESGSAVQNPHAVRPSAHRVRSKENIDCILDDPVLIRAPSLPKSGSGKTIAKGGEVQRAATHGGGKDLKAENDAMRQEGPGERHEVKPEEIILMGKEGERHKRRREHEGRLEGVKLRRLEDRGQKGRVPRPEGLALDQPLLVPAKENRAMAEEHKDAKDTAPPSREKVLAEDVADANHFNRYKRPGARRVVRNLSSDDNEEEGEEEQGPRQVPLQEGKRASNGRVNDDLGGNKPVAFSRPRDSEQGGDGEVLKVSKGSADGEEYKSGAPPKSSMVVRLKKLGSNMGAKVSNYSLDPQISTGGNPPQDDPIRRSGQNETLGREVIELRTGSMLNRSLGLPPPSHQHLVQCSVEGLEAGRKEVDLGSLHSFKELYTHLCQLYPLGLPPRHQARLVYVDAMGDSLMVTSDDDWSSFVQLATDLVITTRL